MTRQLAAARSEILSLTGLRFVAAFIVFAFHIHIRWPLTGNEFAARLISQGAVGMSLFFMLSGYILAYTYYGKNFSLTEFYLNRFARIYPIYAVAALLCVPWLVVVASQGVQGALKGALLVITSTFMIQAWFPQLFTYWNNGGAWSLSAEAFFYITFPFILVGLSGLTNRSLWLALSAAYTFAVLPSLIFAVFDPKPEPALPIFYAMPIYRLGEFITGACVFLIGRNVVVGHKFRALSSLATIILIIYLAIFGDAFPIYVSHNWIVIPTFALLFVSLSSGGGKLSSILSHKIFVWGGKISYCFYSFQLVILLSLILFKDRLPDSGATIFIGAFVLLISISAIGYHLVEEPCRRYIRGNFSPKLRSVTIQST